MINDEYYMRKAMRMALRARGRTSPNPLVGAVVVKDGKVISSGYHKKAGAAHAETTALERCGSRSKGAKLYVTLEPCAHYGRTPPCVDRIIKSGVKEVVAGMIDPNPLNNGKGLALLRRAGIKVRFGVLEDELRRINLPFIKYITKRIPYVTVKSGMSLDGRIASRTGDSKWITSLPAREYSRRARGDFDAIMVGVNTVLSDDPSLSPSYPKPGFKKIILDSGLKISPDARLFEDGYEVIIAVACGLPLKRSRKFQDKAILVPVRRHKHGLDLLELMRKLARLQISSVFVEGGGELNASLFEKELVDRIMFFIAPKIIGGRDAKSVVMGNGVSLVKKALRLKDISCRNIGDDFLVEGDVSYR